MLCSRAMRGTLLVTLAVMTAASGCRSDQGEGPRAARGGAAVSKGDAAPAAAVLSARAGDRSSRRPAEDEGREREAPPPAQVSAYGQAMILGDAALYSGRFEEARRQYFEAMELEPEGAAAALGALRTLVLPGQGEARAAVEDQVRRKIEAYLARPATEGAAHLLAARLALALGETGEALDKARLAVERMPELGVAWRVLGEAAMSAELWGEAVAALQRAAGLGLQAAPGTWERMADAFDELGELRDAEAAARKALALTGSDVHAKRRRLNLLAVVLKHRGELDEAWEVAREAERLGPTDPAVLHNLGTLSEARGKPDEALAYYDKAVADGPHPMTSWRMGHLLLELDKPNEALTAFTAAAARLERWTWPASTRWWPAWEVGKLYARARRHKQAAGWFEDALREARTAAATREVRSWLAFVQTQTDEER